VGEFVARPGGVLEHVAEIRGHLHQQAVVEAERVVAALEAARIHVPRERVARGLVMGADAPPVGAHSAATAGAGAPAAARPQSASASMYGLPENPLLLERRLMALRNAALGCGQHGC
jgi:hypothetical protein